MDKYKYVKNVQYSHNLSTIEISKVSKMEILLRDSESLKNYGKIYYV